MNISDDSIIEVFEPDLVYKVLIRCNTYNHAPYIEETLNGFSLQKTGFPFVCIVVDDNSLDGEQNVIKNWISTECDIDNAKIIEIPLSTIIIVSHMHNSDCIYAFYLLKQNLYSNAAIKDSLLKPWRDRCQYEAICEGDDYWTYDKKLSEQVLFLESHKDYSAIASNSIVFYSDTKSKRLFSKCPSKTYYELKEIVTSRKFHTASVLLRINKLYGTPFINKGEWDTFKWCCLLTSGPIYYDDKVTCVYRKGQQGVTESSSRLEWAKRITVWSSILTDTFAPKYVKRKYIVRGITRDLIKLHLLSYKEFTAKERKQIRTLYFKNFELSNIFYDLFEMFKDLIKVGLHIS